MLKKILKNLFKWLVKFGLTALFRYIDKNNDGKIDRDEIDTFVADVKKLLNKVKNRNQVNGK